MNIFSGAYILIWLTFIIGWIMNIYKFIGMLGGEITTWFIARGVGIFFAPMGAILGFF